MGWGGVEWWPVYSGRGVAEASEDVPFLRVTQVKLGNILPGLQAAESGLYSGP